MGCHPSHWRTPSFFRGVGQPATSLMMWLYIVLFALLMTHEGRSDLAPQQILQWLSVMSCFSCVARLFGPWFPHRHLASRFFSPLKDGFSLMICEPPRFTCAQWFIWIPYWIPYNAKYMRNTVNWHPQFWTIPMCFIFESCVDFFCLGSWGWSTWNVTRKPYVTRCRKVLRACWAICWLGHLLELLLEEMTPNHNRIASARQCILLILLSVKSDSIMLWWFKKWNETRHSEKMVDIWFWELSCSICFIPTMPRKSARRQAGGGSAKWAAEENITMSYHVSFVENICSCVLFPRLWARISRT